MSIIRPFQGIRPSKEKASLIAALPYDVMNSAEARKMVEGNAYSFLHVDKAEIDLEEGTNPYDKSVYEKARDNLNKMISDGTMIQDKQNMLYIYSLTMDGNTQTGLVACTSIDEYLNGTIKKHELTREDKEQDRINHVDYCNANTGAIFLAYQGEKEITDMIQNWIIQNSPIYDFVSDDGIEHKAWQIDDKETISQLKKCFQAVKNLYIADGHHRNASAVKVGLKRREQKPGYTGNEEFNFYLSVLFPAEELNIFDYNRVVKDLNGFRDEEFIFKLKQCFYVEEIKENGCYRPMKRHEFGMYLSSRWYCLDFKSELVSQDAVEALDVSILQNEVLNKILDISDARTDKRIDFVGGIRGLKELEKRVDSGEMRVAFSLFPTSMEELMAIADADRMMPPKSTWFEPKLRSGLFIHSLKD